MEAKAKGRACCPQRADRINEHRGRIRIPFESLRRAGDSTPYLVQSVWAMPTLDFSGQPFRSSLRAMKMSEKGKRRQGNGSLRPHSSIVLDGPERAPSRAMLYPVGFKPEDFSKPMVGIASSWSMVTPCNMHLDQLARLAEAGANEAGGKAIIFDTITISDGISMGT